MHHSSAIPARLGWRLQVFKVSEGEALQVSPLLNKLTSLQYVYFEGWAFTLEQQVSFLAVLVTNAAAFQRLKHVRFTGGDAPGAPQHLPFSCMRSLLTSIPNINQLSLPPLAEGEGPDKVRCAHGAHGAAIGMCMVYGCLTRTSLTAGVTVPRAAG